MALANARQPERSVWRPERIVVFASLAYTVGLWDIWRFPYICHKHGGYVFLVPYLSMLALLVYPLLLLQMLPSQYCSRSGAVVYSNVAPIAAGVGWSILLVEVFTSMYYNVLIAKLLYYYHDIMQWTPNANTINDCILTGPGTRNAANYNSSASSSSATSVASVFQTGDMQYNPLVGGEGSSELKLLLCYTISWLVLLLTLMRKTYDASKGLYMISVIPLVIMTMAVIAVKTTTCQTAFPSSDWSHVADPQAWLDAGTHALYTFGLTLTGVSSIASHNTAQRNICRDALLVVFFDTIISLLSYEVVRCLLVVLDAQGNVPDDDNNLWIFEAFPEILCFEMGWVWAPILFLMMIIISMSSQAFKVLSITINLEDWFPILRTHRKKLLTVTCFVLWILGVVMTTSGGHQMLKMLEKATTGPATLLICLLQTLLISIGCGYSQLLGMMTGTLMRQWVPACARLYLKITWMCLTPAIIVLLLLCSVHYTATSERQYPNIFYVLELFVNFLIVSVTFVFAIYKICTRRTTLRQLLQPTPHLVPDAQLEIPAAPLPPVVANAFDPPAANALPAVAANALPAVAANALPVVAANALPVVAANALPAVAANALPVVAANALPAVAANAIDPTANRMPLAAQALEANAPPMSPAAVAPSPTPRAAPPWVASLFSNGSVGAGTQSPGTAAVCGAGTAVAADARPEVTQVEMSNLTDQNYSSIIARTVENADSASLVIDETTEL